MTSRRERPGSASTSEIKASLSTIVWEGASGALGTQDKSAASSPSCTPHRRVPMRSGSRAVRRRFPGGRRMPLRRSRAMHFGEHC